METGTILSGLRPIPKYFLCSSHCTIRLFLPSCLTEKQHLCPLNSQGNHNTDKGGILHKGIFEGLKAYRKQDGGVLLFRPEENALQMSEDAKRLPMPSPTVLGVAPSPEYTFLIFVTPVGNYFKEGLSEINLIVETEKHQATPGGTGGIKTMGNYAAGLRAQTVAQAQGYSDVL